MEEALSVHVENSISELLGDMSNFPLLESQSPLLPFSDKFIEILLDIFEDEVGLVNDPDDLFHSDDVRMVHFPECFDFGKLETFLPSTILLL